MGLIGGVERDTHVCCSIVEGDTGGVQITCNGGTMDANLKNMKADTEREYLRFLDSVCPIVIHVCRHFGGASFCR